MQSLFVFFLLALRVSTFLSIVHVSCEVKMCSCKVKMCKVAVSRISFFYEKTGIYSILTIQLRSPGGLYLST